MKVLQKETPKTIKNDLANFVRHHGGPDAIAKKLGVTGGAVRYWLNKEVSPTTKHMIKLIKLSKGKLTFESIIRSTKEMRGEK